MWDWPTQKETVDITGYFRGGKEPVTYKLVPYNADPTHQENEDSVFDNESFFTAEIDEATGVLTIAARSATAPVTPADLYTTGEKLRVKAIDADKIESEVEELFVKANRAPVVPGEDNPPVVTLTVGSQDATDSMRDGLDAMGKKTTIQPNPLCVTFRSCVFTIAMDDTATPSTAMFTSNLEGAAASGQAVTIVTDDDVAGMMFSVVSNDEQVQVSASGATITIIGLKSTVKDGANVPATVTIKATDTDGLYVERDLSVTVDTPPEIESRFESSYSFTRSETAALVISNVRSHFKDAEDTTLEIRVKTSDARKVALPDDYTDGVMPASDENLELVVDNIGTSTITVTAVDDRGQMVEQTFTVTGKAS